MLEQLVYISAAQERQTPELVASVLAVSRERNAANGISGLLVGGGNWWLQLIEGERPALEPVWQSILRDRRHHQVVLVQRRGVRRRSFGDWSMGYREAEDGDFDQLVDELTGGIGDPRLKDQIGRFVQHFLVSPDRQQQAAGARRRRAAS
jgi:hypothetical protein